MDNFRTGIAPLDREFSQGLPIGSLLTVKARPDTQSELLLYSLAQEEDTVYITTHREKQLVKTRMEQSDSLRKIPHLINIDPTSPLDELNQRVQSLPDNCYIIIDSIDLIEDLGKLRYQKFLNDLKKHLSKSNSIGVLHAYKYGHIGDPPKNRFLTESMSDIIFELEFLKNGVDIETRLTVSKFRGGRALEQVEKLELTDRVKVDTSRDI